MAGDVAGLVALVTGAAGGIGVATVAALAEAGASVVAADVDSGAAEKLAAELTAQGFSVLGRGVDVSDEDSVRDLIEFTVEAYGRLDVLDNNAALTSAIARDADVATMSVELWDEVMAVNLRGPMLLCKHAVPVLAEGGGGSIINIASGQGLSGDRTMVAYGTSKGGLIALTRFVAAAYGEYGIRCNAIAPGVIGTAALERDMPKPVQELIRGATLVPRLGTPDDVAALVRYLASPASSFVTAQVLAVDGGILAHLPVMAPPRKVAPHTTDLPAGRTLYH